MTLVCVIGPTSVRNPLYLLNDPCVQYWPHLCQKYPLFTEWLSLCIIGPDLVKNPPNLPNDPRMHNRSHLSQNTSFTEWLSYA